MMNTTAREKLYKSWTGISEVALIKEVATKGEYIDLCIDYWARKRKLPIAEYELFFHDVVQTYVQRLLLERLVYKAETVLRNVRRDVRCCYFQFACECGDDDLREQLLDYLQKKNPYSFPLEVQELQFNWEILQQVQKSSELLAKCKQQWRTVNLESLMACDAAFRQRLEVELYFANTNQTSTASTPTATTTTSTTMNSLLLARIDKQTTWQFLIDQQILSEIVRWCCCHNRQSKRQPAAETAKEAAELNENTPAEDSLEELYGRWPIEADMYAYALKSLPPAATANEVLRNCFATAGHFFADERDNVVALLRRICTTQSFAQNAELLEKLPLGQYLLERPAADDQERGKMQQLLLRDFVNVRELEELAEARPQWSALLQLVVALKENNLQERAGFEQAAASVKCFLSADGDGAASVDFNSEQPLVTFHEFLCNEPTVAALHCFALSSALKLVPYLQAVVQRNNGGDAAANGGGSSNGSGNTAGATSGGGGGGGNQNMPTPYDLLRKFRNLDFRTICRPAVGGTATAGSGVAAATCEDPVASFSNERLCQRYARTYHMNFLHYLKQQRGAYAVYYFITEQLHHYAQLTKAQLFSASETVTEMALQHAGNRKLVTHCVAFMEMLGFDTQQLRCLLKLARLLEEVDGDVPARRPPSSHAQLMSRVEDILLQRLDKEPQRFPLAEYTALMRLVSLGKVPSSAAAAAAVVRFWPALIMRRYAADNDWWRLLVLLQYYDVPLGQLRLLSGHFASRHMGEHLLRALAYELPTGADRGGKWRASSSRHGKVAFNTSIETINSSLSSFNDGPTNSGAQRSASACVGATQHRYLPDANGHLDLFAIVLLSSYTGATAADERITDLARFMELMLDVHMAHATSLNLLRNAVKFRLPILAVLAATVGAAHLVDWCWLVWLSVASEQWQALTLRRVVVVTRGAAQTAVEVSWRVIETAVRQGHTHTLCRSFTVFHEDNPLLYLLRFLQRTQHGRDFGDESVHELRLFLLAWSNGEVRVPLSADGVVVAGRGEQLMQRCIRLLLVHLQANFDSTLEQQRFLECICLSDIGDMSCGGTLDFSQLCRVFGVMDGVAGWAQRFPINVEDLLQRENRVYSNLLAALLTAKEYDAAVRLASLLQLPINDIVYAKWVAGLEDADNGNESVAATSGVVAVDRCAGDRTAQDLIFQRYEEELIEHALPPELLVNFLLHAAARLDSASNRKYVLLKRALDVIKRNHLFPNESFDRDQIEYDMIVCYLQVDEAAVRECHIFHSEYYEQIMMRERCVLYKSFLELKELAGIDDLTIAGRVELSEAMVQRLEALLNRLLDEGDIVEALRLQELFECRPLDLRFVVFCMALAEGVTTVCDMSVEERKMLRDVELSAFAKFNKRTLGLMRNSGGSGSREQGTSSPLKSLTHTELSDSASTLEFEEIPSKEKRETLDTIQGIASKLRNGIQLGKRILMAYRAAMYLDKEYMDVLRTKDVGVLLKSVAEEGCMHRLMVVSDILTSTQMTPQEIAELLAYEITTAVVRPRFYIFSPDQQAKNKFQSADLWGYNIDRDLHLFLELTPNTTCLGNRLLDYCDALKAYRKFQDNKPYQHNATFERLAEIISRYGLPPPASPSSGISSALTVSTPSLAAVVGGAVNNSSAITTSLTTGTSSGHAGAGGGGGGAGTGMASPNGPPQVLSHKKQNLIYVELLIKAHQCFVHECCMEGIANVLNRAKSLNATLTKAKSWSLIVRMLIGIGRYREMFYCFDALIENEQFESLLGQFDEDRAIGLRQAVIAYLREYRPEDGRDYLKLAALHFLMYKDLAEMWETDARQVLKQVLAASRVDPAQLPEQDSMNSLTTGGSPSVAKVAIPKLRCSAELVAQLQQALENYTHATENYLLDNKLLLAQKSVAQAELVAMQLDLATRVPGRGSGSLPSAVQMAMPAMCVCVIGVQTREEFRELVNAELSVPQSLILSRAYGYDINWMEALLSQFVLLKKKSYLDEYLTHLAINDTIIHNVVKSYQAYTQHHIPTRQMGEHLAQLVDLVKSITLKYKLASLLSLKSTVMSLISDHTLYYLRDTNFGRNENLNMPDI